MLTPQGCRARQQRLLETMRERRWQWFVTGNYRTVYYFTGALTSPDTPAYFALHADGESILVTSSSAPAAATRILPLETYSIERSIIDPAADAARLLHGALARQGASPSLCASESCAASLHEVWPHAQIANATPVVLRLRKRKEEDEIAEIRAALRLSHAAYDAARATIRPGLTEIDVFNAMQAAVNREAGTSVPLVGDFACGERAIRGGGPPTHRKLEEGELYVLDLFPAPALYFGDVCRTFAVGAPSDLQLRACEIVKEAVRRAEAAVKPGVRARDVYAVVKDFLDAYEESEGSFWHHAGHGIGYQVGHEAPRIIPGSDDLFEAGDVITLEPGIYTKALQGGVRLEDNYVVREEGLERLFEYSKELG